MELIKDICEITGGISAACAIIISIIVYWHGVSKERKINTIKELSTIRKKYFNTKGLDNKEKLKFLNELEFFATGINERIYDIRIARKMSGSRLIKQYDNWAADFILERKKKYGKDTAYSEYEKMIQSLKQIKK